MKFKSVPGAPRVQHTVQSGDTLDSIARQYGVHPTELEKRNALLCIGGLLKIRGPETISTPGVVSPVMGHHIVNYPYGAINPHYQAGFHTGEDYPAPEGTPVIAVRDGTVVWGNNDGGSYGVWLGLRADNGRDYIYCHLHSTAVAVGVSVKAGTIIGYVGKSGSAGRTHLHFEDRPSGGGYGQVRKPTW